MESWVANTNPRNMFLSAVSILEVKIGALRLYRRDQSRGAALDEWSRDRVLTKFEGRILPFDALTALRATFPIRLQTATP